MRFQTIKCVNCGAELDLDFESLKAYCPYCGQKLLFDDQTISTALSEREKTKRWIFKEREKTKRRIVTEREITTRENEREKEQTRRAEIPYVYEERKDIRAKKHDMRITLLGILFLAASLGFGFFMANKEEQEHLDNHEVKLKFSASDLKGTSPNYVEQRLKSVGFTDIQIIENKNLITQVIADKNDVVKVEINGNTTFKENDWYPQDAEIKVYYNP